VLELDSSSPVKFSRHLLVRVPGWAFAHNADVGAFVRSITHSPAGLQTLYVYKDPPPPPPAAAAATAAAGQRAGGAEGRGEERAPGQQQGHHQQQRARVCFVDGAVYSKNRHFRLFGSTKGGKAAWLEPTLRYCMSAACRCGGGGGRADGVGGVYV